MEGTFKTLPQQGDTLFQLERVSEGPPGIIVIELLHSFIS